MSVENNKPRRQSVKDKYETIKNSMKSNPDPIAFTDEYEEKLRESLFEKEIEEAKKKEQEAEENPDFEQSGYVYIVEHRDGLWDYTKDDDIDFFDPSKSYELTGYKPINDKLGLDFDPTPFRETGIIFETTGSYCEYPKDCKPYVDFWNEQKRRCVDGYEVNGYRITGDHYFFLNFYRLPVTKDKDGITFVEEGFPVFTTEHYKWFHYVEICEYLKKDVAALKCRGVETALLYSNI